MEDEKDMVWVERKVTGERKAKAFLMRRGEAIMQASLTNAMQQARREIEQARRFQVGDLGVSTLCARIRTRGSAYLEPSEYMIKILDQYKRWFKECGVKDRNAVISFITAEGMLLSDLATLCGVSRKTLSKRYKSGLNEYCILNGWGDQLKSR